MSPRSIALSDKSAKTIREILVIRLAIVFGTDSSSSVIAMTEFRSPLKLDWFVAALVSGRA
jgi:hypothetical protein